MAVRLGSLCSGYDGLALSLGVEPVWVSDIDPGACRILEHRYAAPNLGDLTTVDWSDVEPVDVLVAGFPCQPFSQAGKRKGTEDDRHIWPYICDAVRVLRPRVALMENVTGLLTLGFGVVLGDLAEIGYDAEWCCVRASDAGAPHRRERVFIAAHPAGVGRERVGTTRGRRHGPAERGATAPDASRGSGTEPDSGTVEPGLGAPRRDDVERLGAVVADTSSDTRRERYRNTGAIAWGVYEPAIRRWERILGRPAPAPTDERGRLAPRFVEWMMGLPDGWVTGVPGLTRTAQLKALGNGVVPHQARLAWEVLL